MPMQSSKRRAQFRVAFDEQARPVAIQLEEQRLGEPLAVEGAALDEETVAPPMQQTVDELRVAVTNRFEAPSDVRISVRI